jgi:hypothetical protein
MFVFAAILPRIPLARDPQPTSPTLTAELLFEANTMFGFRMVRVDSADTFLIKFLLFIMTVFI